MTVIRRDQRKIYVPIYAYNSAGLNEKLVHFDLYFLIFYLYSTSNGIDQSVVEKMIGTILTYGALLSFIVTLEWEQSPQEKKGPRCSIHKIAERYYSRDTSLKVVFFSGGSVKKKPTGNRYQTLVIFYTHSPCMDYLVTGSPEA